jgi:cell filamentation protein
MPGYTLADGLTVKNKIGATNPQALEDESTDFVAGRIFELEAGLGPKGQFDAAHLKAIHRHLFQDVFEFAGHTRNDRFQFSDGAVATEVALRKPGGQQFMLGPFIDHALDRVAAKLQGDNFLKGLPRSEFAERAADVMIQLNSIHPFREGNGRTQRTFLRELAKEAGHSLDFSVISQERMRQASVAAHERGDPAMMRRMFAEISDPARVDNLKRGIAALERNEVDWNDRYVATTDPGHRADLVMVGVIRDQFMATDLGKRAIFFGHPSELPLPNPEPGQRFTLPDLGNDNPGEERAERFLNTDRKDAAQHPDLAPAFQRLALAEAVANEAGLSAQDRAKVIEASRQGIASDLRAGRGLDPVPEKHSRPIANEPELPKPKAPRR